MALWQSQILHDYSLLHCSDNKPNVCQSQYFPIFHKIYNKTGLVTFKSYFILTTQQSHRDCKLPNGATISKSIISKDTDKEKFNRKHQVMVFYIYMETKQKDACSCTGRSSHNAIQTLASQTYIPCLGYYRSLCCQHINNAPAELRVLWKL